MRLRKLTGSLTLNCLNWPKLLKESAKSAALKTKREREEAMRDFCDFKALLKKMSYEGER